MSSNSSDVLQQEWPQSSEFKKSIRMEFSIYISSMIFLLMIIAGSVIMDRYVDSVTQAAADKLLVQARSYSGPAGKLIISTTGPDALLLNNICKKLAADNSDIIWVAITGREDTLLAHTDISKVAKGGSLTPVIGGEYPSLLRNGEGFKLADETINISVPIAEGDVKIGHLHLSSSAAKISEARQDSIVAVATISVLALLLGLPLIMIGLHRKLKPISTITDHLKDIRFDNIQLDIPVTGRNELGYLAETLRVMGGKLNAAQKEMIEAERISREFEIAREIQSSMLPSAIPTNDHYSFTGFYRSAKEVGGDYYDFIKLSDTKVAFLVADVSGKSLPGMLVMLLTRDIVKKHCYRTHDPVSLICKVNQELLANIKKGMFVTMFYGVLDYSTGTFSFASAGHNPLIVMNDHQAPRLIKTKGFPLGMVPPDQFDRRIERGEIVLKPHDWLVQYTDGVNEAQNQDHREYGMDRLVTRLHNSVMFGPEQMIDAIVADLDQFVGEQPQFDDITLIAMKFGLKSVDSNSMKKEVCY
ncbi:MAG: PP2C family protein-serine/threonine phosphatase [bacterium]|nr:PP2C family protein-serine/threonine phosphatase [bacterium]